MGEMRAEDEDLVGREPEGEAFWRGIGGVFEGGVGFEEIVGEMGIGEAVNPAIAGGAFEKECAFLGMAETGVWGRNDVVKRSCHRNIYRDKPMSRLWLDWVGVTPVVRDGEGL